MSKISNQFSQLDLSMIMAATTLWGLSFVVIKLGLDSLPPLFFSALRFSLTTLPWIFFMPAPYGLWKPVITAGLLLGVGKFSLMLISLDGLITPGLSSLVLQSQVFFTIAISYLFLSEKITAAQIIGMSIAIAGLIIMINTHNQDSSIIGILMVLMAGLLWSIANIIIKSMRIEQLLPIMIWAFAMAPIPLFILSYVFESQQPISLLKSITISGWASIAFLAYGSTLLAYGLWYHLLRKHTAAKITPFALLIPIVGLLSSAIITGESITLTTLLAIVMIMLGLLLSIIKIKSQYKNLTSANISSLIKKFRIKT